MINFAGWEMPVQFSSVMNEHFAVRKQAGLFDISHMGVFLVEGQNVKDAFQNLVPTDLFRIGPGEACYTVLLNESGGIIDDLIIYDLGAKNSSKESIIVVINSANTESDIKWIKEKINLEKISITDRKKDGILLALQGPESIKILQKFCKEELTSIPRFGHKNISIFLKEANRTEEVFLARTGYTGEDGFELLINKEAGQSLWQKLLSQGVSPCGLGARDSLRLEAAMHLYGNDMNTTITPFEAGLGWLVHLEKPEEFIGRKALEKQGQTKVKRLLVGLELEERGIARNGYKIFYKNKEIGKVTSGTWSPTLRKGIAMGYIPKELTALGTQVSIEIRGKNYPAKVAKKPFYRKLT